MTPTPLSRCMADAPGLVTPGLWSKETIVLYKLPVAGVPLLARAASQGTRGESQERWLHARTMGSSSSQQPWGWDLQQLSLGSLAHRDYCFSCAPSPKSALLA